MTPSVYRSPRARRRLARSAAGTRRGVVPSGVSINSTLLWIEASRRDHRDLRLQSRHWSRQAPLQL